MKQRFDLLIKNSGLTLDEIARKAGYTVDYIHRLKRESAKERMNVDNLKAFADALDLYPSELLPLEWQKPTASGELDVSKLKQAALDADELLLAAGKKIDNYHKKLELIAEIYKFLSGEEDGVKREKLSKEQKVIFLKLVK